MILYIPWKSKVGLRTTVFSSKGLSSSKRSFTMIYMMESVDFQGIFKKMSVVWDQTLHPHHLQIVVSFVAERWCVTSCLWPFTWCHATKNACQETQKVTPLVASRERTSKIWLGKNWCPDSLRILNLGKYILEKEVVPLKHRAFAPKIKGTNLLFHLFFMFFCCFQGV